MSTQIYDLIDLNQSKSGLCIRKNNHYTNRAFRAEDEVRTRDPQLGRLMLYRLSYFRISGTLFLFKNKPRSLLNVGA